MKFRILTSFAAILLTALAAHRQPAGSAPGNYYLVNLGTPVGGTVAGPHSINNLGWIAGGHSLRGTLVSTPPYGWARRWILERWADPTATSPDPTEQYVPVI